MFQELDPDSEAYESFKKFCIAAAIEACHPRKAELHYYLLDHPTTDKSLMLVYEKGPHERFYLTEVTLGKTINFDSDEEAFYSWDMRYNPLPATAVIAEDQVTLGYPDPQCPQSIKCRTTSLEKYELLKGLFDEENPLPWKELSIPVVPRVGSSGRP